MPIHITQEAKDVLEQAASNIELSGDPHMPRFSMYVWLEKTWQNGENQTDYMKRKIGYNCGTACCIAGTMGLIYYGESKVNEPDWIFTDDRLCDDLGLDRWTMSELFMPWDYRDTNKFPGKNGDVSPTITPQCAAKVIRHLIETGVVDWSVGFNETEKADL